MEGGEGHAVLSIFTVSLVACPQSCTQSAVLACLAAMKTGTLRDWLVRGRLDLLKPPHRGLLGPSHMLPTAARCCSTHSTV